jgi:hypothetical protein
MIEEETTAADLCSRDRFPHPRQAIPRRVAPQHSSSLFRLTEDVRSQMESAPCGFQCYQFDALTISGELQFLANDPRVLRAIQHEVNQWGLPKDEFTDNGGWPHELYIREARRMTSDYVMTQHDCEGRAEIDDAIGLAAYTIDSHHVQRYVKDGRVWNEGDVEVGGFPPYPIAYRSIRPKRKECENLLIPVCVSASHIAFGSIRMEPVFMVLGQSTATAACMAIDDETAVQDVDVAELQAKLKKDGQVLSRMP